MERFGTKGSVGGDGGDRRGGAEGGRGGAPRRAAARRDAGGWRQGTAARITSPFQTNPELEGRPPEESTSDNFISMGDM